MVEQRGVSFTYGEGTPTGFDDEMHSAAGGTTGWSLSSESCSLSYSITMNRREGAAAPGAPPAAPGADTELVSAPSVADAPSQYSAQAQDLEYFDGAWLMGVAAVGTSYQMDGSTLWRTDTATYADAGFLQIHPDGTYVWKVYPNDPPETYRTGRWEPATAEDMRLSATPSGAGLILRSGHDDTDWLVTRRQSSDGGEEITVAWRHMQAIQQWGRRFPQ